MAPKWNLKTNNMLDKLLNRPVSVTMTLLVFVVLGLVGMGRLPVSLIPDVDIPYVTVQVSAPDMSAREIDDAIVKPLRQSLVQINHLKGIRSESRDGSAVVTLDFDEGENMDYFFIEVNEKIDRTMGALPRIERPKVIKASATDIPAFYINMTLKEIDAASQTDDTELYPVSDAFLQMSDFARNVITKRIEQIPEVAMVDISGTVSGEILIIPDLEALASLGITLNRFESIVSSANVSLSNLTIRDGEYHYNVKFQSFASSVEDIENVYFKISDRILQIKDVARVIEHPSRRSGLDMSDGSDAVILAVIKQSEARMSNLKNAISEQLSVYREDYPQIDFTITRDQTELLEYSIRNLILNIVLAVLLDCIIIFLFMKDLRSPLLVSMAIPLSLVISFFVFYVLGVSINIISLSGMLLGIGMMVDNTIVLVDNITSRWLRGDPLRSAVREGAIEVSGPMLSSVLTTCAVFIPLVFVNGLAGQLFFDQAVTVTTVLLVSYLVTMLALPVYYWAFYKKFKSFKSNAILSRIQLKWAVELYDTAMNWCLKNRWVSWTVLACSVLLAAVCLNLMPKSRLPEISYTDAIMVVNWNEHITIGENRSRVESLRTALDGLCSQATAMVGIQQFVLGHSGNQSMSEASLYLKADSPSELRDIEMMLSSILSQKWPYAVTQWRNSGNIFDMVFSDREPQLLARLCPTGGHALAVDELQHTLTALHQALPEIGIPSLPLKEDVMYVSDPERMVLYGVSFGDLVKVLENSLNGNAVFEIVRGNRIIPVIMGTDVREMGEILASSTVAVGEGYVPVSALMKQSYVQDLKSIVSGEEGNYYPLALDVEGTNVEDVIETVRHTINEDGQFDVSFSGAWFSNNKMIRQMLMVLLVAVLLLFLILASQFESLIQPFIILTEIVIDIAVSLLVLWIAGVSINIMSLIGMVVVSGIVINDSILKIDTINKLRRSGMGLEKSIHEAGHRRLKAIVMTSLTTILAVAPFLSRGNMGDDLQYPMALVIIAGMFVGTFVSLFFVPAVYSSIYSNRKGK